MSKHGSLRDYCNSWVYQMVDKYFRKAGISKWIWNDAGARLNITAVGIGSIANGTRFPSKPVFDRIVEMAKPLGWTDSDEIFGYIARDYVIKNGHLPSGWGNGGWGGFLVSYVVKCINDILPENEKLEVLREFDYSTMSPRSGGVEANIIIEKEDLLQKPGLSPKEFLEQNGWFDKAKDAAEKTAKEISDKMTQNVKEAYDEKGFATLNDIYKDTPLEVEPISQSYGFADKVGMVKPIQNLELANPFDDESANAAEISEDVKSDIINKFLFMLVQRIDESDLMDLLYGHVSRKTYEAFYKIDKLCYEDGINLRVVINSIINSLSNEILNGKKEDPLV